MAKKRFSAKDIEQLLSHYRAERRRLTFQLDSVRRSIKELRALKPAASGEEGAPAKRGPGRPRRTDAEGVVRRRRGRKPGRRKKRTIKEGGYRLNPIDTAVVNAITNKKQLLTKQELLEVVKKWAVKGAPKMKVDEMEARLTRSLQKLSGKRGTLGTHRTGLQRGYHYGLKDWFFSTTGKLRRQHLDKLVISNK